MRHCVSVLSGSVGLLVFPFTQNHTDLIATMLFSRVSRSIGSSTYLLTFFLARFAPVLFYQCISGSAAKRPLKTAGWDLHWTYIDWMRLGHLCSMASSHHWTLYCSPRSCSFLSFSLVHTVPCEDLVHIFLGVSLAPYCSCRYGQWLFLLPSSRLLFRHLCPFTVFRFLSLLPSPLHFLSFLFTSCSSSSSFVIF